MRISDLVAPAFFSHETNGYTLWGSKMIVRRKGHVDGKEHFVNTHIQATCWPGGQDVSNIVVLAMIPSTEHAHPGMHVIIWLFNVLLRRETSSFSVYLPGVRERDKLSQAFQTGADTFILVVECEEPASKILIYRLSCLRKTAEIIAELETLEEIRLFCLDDVNLVLTIEKFKGPRSILEFRIRDLHGFGVRNELGAVVGPNFGTGYQLIQTKNDAGVMDWSLFFTPSETGTPDVLPNRVPTQVAGIRFVSVTETRHLRFPGAYIFPVHWVHQSHYSTDYSVCDDRQQCILFLEASYQWIPCPDLRIESVEASIRTSITFDLTVLPVCPLFCMKKYIALATSGWVCIAPILVSEGALAVPVPVPADVEPPESDDDADESDDDDDSDDENDDDGSEHKREQAEMQTEMEIDAAAAAAAAVCGGGGGDLDLDLEPSPCPSFDHEEQQEFVTLVREKLSKMAKQFTAPV